MRCELTLLNEVEEWEKKLRPKHKAVLRALCECCITIDEKGKRFLAVHVHFPPQAVQSKLKPRFRKKVKTALGYLCAKRLARRHPTSGGMTYHLTRDGLHVAQMLNLFENV
jgi:hypothetical protein